MAKRMYISPLFEGGLDGEHDHTENYSNSQNLYSPDKPNGIAYPDFEGLSVDQVLNFQATYRTAEEALKWDASGDKVIDLNEYLAACPEPPIPSDPE